MRADAARAGVFALALLGAGLVFLQPSPAQETGLQSLSISARPIPEFRIGSSQTRFGPLEFTGGLEMVSRDRDFGALSSFRFLSPGGRFVGVADTGFWFFGTLLHDEEGRPSVVADFTMSAILDPDGRTGEKWTTDAESIAVRDGVVTVGFERQHRISQFRLEPEHMGSAIADLNFLVPSYELRTNRGFETIAYAPAGGALDGALVAVAERSIDQNGNIFAAVLDGPQKGIFTVARRDGFDITDGAFLPDGDLLLLERSFSMATGVGMRLRRIEAETIRQGRVADGPVLLQADMGYQIDNMEALDVWQRPDGATMVSLMSDDNHSILQRNLYLEFRLVEE
ncbi:esterase-like activity of phytase family protein [Chelativorans sp. AA-79]|uniref:esterase-like activity of phytase family protein n=1 Tax=Chelativorans sp. AA-79 TaxID=3028735 RepID=UPI0023F9C076|nr:esterase-like activity of phytase family protein [Chelativorans sp. AA-79]WEX10071.1 esterase-like activity of phytase family protein [Chelativorans sp. AA-79]